MLGELLPIESNSEIKTRYPCKELFAVFVSPYVNGFLIGRWVGHMLPLIWFQVDLEPCELRELANGVTEFFACDKLGTKQDT